MKGTSGLRFAVGITRRGRGKGTVVDGEGGAGFERGGVLGPGGWGLEGGGLEGWEMGKGERW